MPQSVLYMFERLGAKQREPERVLEGQDGVVHLGYRVPR
jgi:hypothetical protein